ncbi:MAG TPA: hypothetical protein VF737_09195 [Gemmatimonadaceae bacterium]
MTTIALHQAPDWKGVLRQQIRTTGAAIRIPAVVVGSVVLLFCVLSVVSAARTTAVRSIHYGYSFNPGILAPVFLLGLLMAAAVWQREEPSRRGYHLAMPVPAAQHTGLRVLVGWGWLMVGIAVLWVCIGLTNAAISGIVGGAPPFARPLSRWFWFEPFASATMTYLLVSIAMIAAERPLGWLVGIPAGLVVLLQIPVMMQADGTVRILQWLSNSPFSFGTPFWPVFQHVAGSGRYMIVDWQRSLLATGIWTAIGIAGVWLAAHKHPRGAK